MEPNKDVIRKWVDALRSGEYRQGDGGLRDENDKFCCLGVLCDLAEKEKVIEEPSLSCSNYYYAYGDEDNDVTLPYEVRSWSGLEDCDPTLIDPTHENDEGYSAAALNDDGKTFAELADLIEAKYLN